MFFSSAAKQAKKEKAQKKKVTPSSGIKVSSREPNLSRIISFVCFLFRRANQ